MNNNKKIEIRARELAANLMNIELSEIDTAKRRREVVQARQIVHYLMRKFTPLSLKNIGKRVGNKDHATVITGIKSLNNLIDTDKRFAKDMREITNVMYQFQKDIDLNGWIRVENDQPPINQCVWLHNPETKSIAIGCMVPGDDCYLWAVSDGNLRIESGKIESYCYRDDYDFTLWKPLTELPFI